MTISLEIREVATNQDYEEAYIVLKELRSTPTFEQVVSICNEAKLRDDFALIAAYSNGKCVAVMGCRVLYDLTHSKHLYIDDLVITEPMRSKGIGQRLIHYAEEKAKTLDCYALRLCTGIENEGAQKFYAREGWTKRSYAYKKFLKTWTKQ